MLDRYVRLGMAIASWELRTSRESDAWAETVT